MRILGILACFAVLYTNVELHADEFESFGTGANQFRIEFVPIGDPGNSADESVRAPAGAVDYFYRIGKHEISREMIDNANAVGGLGISQSSMAFVVGGPRPAMPATGIKWNEAARFVNWMNTSKGFEPAYRFSTQPGEAGYRVDENILLWTANDAGFDAANPFRNSRARYFLPSFDEWYKAAFYDPRANGGIGGYWDYPTGSNLPPIAVLSGTDAGTAVFGQDISQQIDIGPSDILAAGGLSPYGVMALGGNVYEFLETESDRRNDDPLSTRIARSGNWSGHHSSLMAYYSIPRGPTYEDGSTGLRVASVPEPSKVLLMIIGIAAASRRRRLWRTPFMGCMGE